MVALKYLDKMLSMSRGFLGSVEGVKKVNEANVVIMMGTYGLEGFDSQKRGGHHGEAVSDPLQKE